MVEWRAIPGHAPYEASDDGRIRSPHKVLALRLDCSGRPRLNLYVDHRRVTRHASVLVALAFVPNPEGYGIAEHMDGNPANNRVANLRWATQKANCRNRHTTRAASGMVGLDYRAHQINRPWRGRAMDREGIRHTRSFGSKDEAVAFIAGVRRDNFYD